MFLDFRVLNKKVSSDSPRFLGLALPTGVGIHNRFLTKAKAEAGETYSKSAENACVYKGL